MKTYPGREFDTRSTLPHTADLWLTRLSSIIMNLELKLFCMTTRPRLTLVANVGPGKQPNVAKRNNLTAASSLRLAGLPSNDTEAGGSLQSQVTGYLNYPLVS